MILVLVIFLSLIIVSCKEQTNFKNVNSINLEDIWVVSIDSLFLPKIDADNKYCYIINNSSKTKNKAFRVSLEQGTMEKFGKLDLFFSPNVIIQRIQLMQNNKILISGSNEETNIAFVSCFDNEFKELLWEIDLPNELGLFDTPIRFLENEFVYFYGNGYYIYEFRKSTGEIQNKTYYSGALQSPSILEFNGDKHNVSIVDGYNTSMTIEGIGKSNPLFQEIFTYPYVDNVEIIEKLNYSNYLAVLSNYKEKSSMICLFDRDSLIWKKNLDEELFMVSPNIVSNLYLNELLITFQNKQFSKSKRLLVSKNNGTLLDTLLIDKMVIQQIEKENYFLEFTERERGSYHLKKLHLK